MIRYLLAAGCVLSLAVGTASAETKLSLWHVWNPDGAQGKIYFDYIDEFEAANPDVEIEMTTVDSKTYFQKVTAAFAAGDAPDIFAIPARRVISFTDNNAIAPIDEVALTGMGVGSLDELKAKWGPNTLESYQVDGTFYGLPTAYNIYTWMINADHFREAGLDPVADAPKTWDELHAVAEKLVQKDANGRITRPAISFPFSETPAWYMLEYEPVLRQLGGSVLSADGTESLVNNEAGVKAMEAIRRRFDIGVSDKNIAVTADFYRDGFATGQFSMSVAGNWAIPRWAKNFPELDIESTFVAIPIPTFGDDGTGATITTAWGWVVTNASENKELAWKFADFMTSQPNGFMAATGQILPRAGWSSLPAANDMPQASHWAGSLDYAFGLGKFRNYTEISDVIKQMMQSILLSGDDIQTTLDETKAEIDAILQRS